VKSFFIDSASIQAYHDAAKAQSQRHVVHAEHLNKSKVLHSDVLIVTGWSAELWVRAGFALISREENPKYD